MKALLLMILLVPVSAAAQEKKAAEDPTLVVVKFSWKRERRPSGGRPTQSAAGNYPVAGASTLGRMPSSSRQPGEVSMEEQAVTMRQVESRDRRGGVYRVRDFYKYKVTLRNTDARAVRAVYWSFETRQSPRPEDVGRRYFFCLGKIKPGKGREFKAEAPNPPSLTVSADAAAGPDRVVITRVEYTDGSFWQRPGLSHDPVTWRPLDQCTWIPEPERR